jgi:hypothetical protein
MRKQILYGLWNEINDEWYYAHHLVFHTPYRNIAIVQELRLARDLAYSSRPDQQWAVRIIGPNGRPLTEKKGK